jgi:hypothetical protein
VLGAKPAHRVTKGQHGPHRGEGLVGVALDMFPEREGCFQSIRVLLAGASCTLQLMDSSTTSDPAISLSSRRIGPATTFRTKFVSRGAPPPRCSSQSTNGACNQEPPQLYSDLGDTRSLMHRAPPRGFRGRYNGTSSKPHPRHRNCHLSCITASKPSWSQLWGSLLRSHWYNLLP